MFVYVYPRASTTQLVIKTGMPSSVDATHRPLRQGRGLNPAAARARRGRTTLLRVRGLGHQGRP
ncbi:hypothetical protein ACFFX0_32425 [Citricoccus parietis]|uniref:Uncharacterized protein n=1 Tax=Citricoccus parietis TaxID=592307 RepID=A0ABV5G9K3_9MICC